MEINKLHILNASMNDIGLAANLVINCKVQSILVENTDGKTGTQIEITKSNEIGAPGLWLLQDVFVQSWRKEGSEVYELEVTDAMYNRIVSALPKEVKFHVVCKTASCFEMFFDDAEGKKKAAEIAEQEVR
jgi:hypothetical protein